MAPKNETSSQKTRKTGGLTKIVLEETKTANHKDRASGHTPERQASILPAKTNYSIRLVLVVAIVVKNVTPLKHPIIVVWNNKIQNDRFISEKVHFDNGNNTI